MKLIEKLGKKLKHSPIRRFPGAHLIALSVLGVSLGAMSLLPSQNASASRQLRTLELPPETNTPNHSETLKGFSEFEQENNNKNKTIKLKVGKGDNLSTLFKRAGLSDRKMMNFIAAADKSKKLESIRPGHTLSFELASDDSIASLTYTISKLDSYSYTKTEQNTYIFAEQQRKPDVQHASRAGTIKNSLYASGLESGMNDKLIMELAEVFGWDIDFALDIRTGDSFKILYEERFLDGEKIGDGAILSAEFVNQGQLFQAVRYIHKDGRAQYYTPEGKNMRKAFLRAPVDFRRISGSFNPRRLHPITNRVRPHRGIDYAAKTGTPVWSSGDGRVLKSGYSKYNGNYVVIQHGNNVQTKYLHLHKRKVKTGQRVRQKQVIGTVGTTGLSTGPHLHYEFLLNGVHRNPRTIVQKLPKAKSIDPKSKTDFLSATQPLMAEMQAETATFNLALNK